MRSAVAAPLVALTLVGSACSSLPAGDLDARETRAVVGGGDSTASSPTTVATPSSSAPSTGRSPASADPSETTPAPLDGGAEDPGGWSVPDIPVTVAPSLDDLEASELPAPTRLRLDAVGIDAPITDVGIRLDGDLEVPAEAEIGWYRFGPEPGQPGSSVVAAHVDYNGRPGAFFPLRDTRVGDRIEIDRADGSTLDFVVTDVVQYAKDELPEDLWRRDGDPQLVLITCGGPFDRRERSYEDNVVVVAVPVDPAGERPNSG